MQIYKDGQVSKNIQVNVHVGNKKQHVGHPK